MMPPGFRARHVARVEHEELVAPDDAALRVDDPDAVGVAVERDAELGAAVRHRADQVLHVLFDRRIGMVVREPPVHVGEELVTSAPSRR
jgi:hypothetical protein